jgi:hypothetical protein
LKSIHKLPCFKRKRLLQKCGDRFLAELDVNTMLKKLRNSSNPFIQFKEKKVKKYLKLHKSITVEDSSSGEEEKEDQFKENVEDGFFSSDEKSEDEIETTDHNVAVAKFKELFQQMIINQSIDDIQISQE